MPTREFGLADLTCHSDLALASAGSEVLAGAGDIGDLIGVADIPCMAVADISRAAPRFTTGPISIGLAELVAAFIAEAFKPAETLVPAGTWPHAAEFTIAQARFPGHSMEVAKLLEDTRNLADRLAFAPAPLAALIMEDKPEASPHADSPASVVEAASTAVAGATVVAGGVSPHLR